MDGNTSLVDGDDVDWDTDDELEIENFTLSSSANPGFGEASSSSGPSQTKVYDHFVSMEFSHNMVSKAIQEHGLEDADLILETLLLYNALESSPPEQHSLPELHSPPEQCSPQERRQIDLDLFSSDYDGSFLDGFSERSDDEVTIDPTSEAEKNLCPWLKWGTMNSRLQWQ